MTLLTSHVAVLAKRIAPLVKLLRFLHLTWISGIRMTCYNVLLKWSQCWKTSSLKTIEFALTEVLEFVIMVIVFVFNFLNWFLSLRKCLLSSRSRSCVLSSETLWTLTWRLLLWNWQVLLRDHWKPCWTQVIALKPIETFDFKVKWFQCGRHVWFQVLWLL